MKGLFLALLLFGVGVCGCSMDKDIDKSVIIENLNKSGNITSEGGGNSGMKAYDETLKAVEELNKNSKLGVELLKKSSGTGTFNPQAPESDTLDSENSLDGKFYYFPYPYDKSKIFTEADCKLTQLYLYAAKYNVFGIKVGDSIESADKVMQKYGYKKNTDKDPNYQIRGVVTTVYQKFDICVRFYLGEDNNTIKEILIFVNSTK